MTEELRIYKDDSKSLRIDPRAGGQPFKFDPLAVPLGPADGTRYNYLLDLLIVSANVSLTEEQRASYLTVIESLPAGATLGNFMRAAHEHEATARGVSAQTYEAASPLLLALIKMQDGNPLYTDYFTPA